MIEERTLVMVVDDDLAVRESLKFALELEGMKVRVLGSGAELLAHPDLPRAQCLILDYKMPGMDGFEVLEHLAHRNLRLPVILIASHATEALRRRAAALDIRRVLEKPLSDGALADSIRDAVSDCL